MKKNLRNLLPVLLLAASGVQADDALTIEIKKLSLEAALTIAQEALATCRKEGVQVAVTVVDRAGQPQVVLRDVLAPELTLTISGQKAYTAASFVVPTSTLNERAISQMGSIDGLAMFAGGLPIQAGGQLLGAVGVSGAPSGETDEACAQAGIDKIQDDLELE